MGIFESKKTLIVVYEDEMVMNQLRKSIESKDDKKGKRKGVTDDSINLICWDEKVWLDHKKAGNIKGKVLFLGEIRGTDKLIPVLDLKFDEYGVKFGYAGNQAVLYADVDALRERKKYDEFLIEFSSLPVPEDLKQKIEEKEHDPEEPIEIEAISPSDVDKPKGFWDKAKEKLNKLGDKISIKSEELFRDRWTMKRQMLLYGAIKLYEEELESFINA